MPWFTLVWRRVYSCNSPRGLLHVAVVFQMYAFQIRICSAYVLELICVQFQALLCLHSWRSACLFSHAEAKLWQMCFWNWKGLWTEVLNASVQFYIYIFSVSIPWPHEHDAVRSIPKSCTLKGTLKCHIPSSSFVVHFWFHLFTMSMWTKTKV